MNVAILDDSSNITWIIEHYINTNFIGVKCDVYNSSIDYVNLIRNKEIPEYDILFLDIVMPVYTGLDVLQQYEDSGISPNNVVIISSLDKDSFDKKLFNDIDYIVGYCPKPIKLEDISKHITLISEKILTTNYDNI